MVKETKLYDLLGVSPTADDAELKKGYRKAALKYHPDKPTGNEDKFKDVGEAYDILSHKDKRDLYDQYGLDVARSGQPPMPDFGAGGGGGFPGGGGTYTSTGGFPGGFPGGGSTFSSFGGGGGNPFSTQDAFNIFSMFGGGGMDDDMGGFGGGSGFGGGGFGSSGFGGSGFGGGGSTGRRTGRKSQRTEPVEPKQIDLPVALRDLYTGTTKKLKIKHRGASGATESSIVEVTVKPGWKSGTKLTYKGKGDVQPDGSVQDIVFVIQEKPDPEFERDGNDVKMKLKVPFKDAMLGFSEVITTLDGKKLRVSQSRPVQAGQVISFPERGMPISKSPGHFGDLKVEVQVAFPETLTPEQRKVIEENF